MTLPSPAGKGLALALFGACMLAVALIWGANARSSATQSSSRHRLVSVGSPRGTHLNNAVPVLQQVGAGYEDGPRGTRSSRLRGRIQFQTEFCTNGVAVVDSDATACCPASCGQCGGAYCGTRQGGWQCCANLVKSRVCTSSADVACRVPSSQEQKAASSTSTPETLIESLSARLATPPPLPPTTTTVPAKTMHTAAGIPSCLGRNKDDESGSCDSKLKCTSNETAVQAETRRLCPRMCGLCLEELDQTIFCPDPLRPVLERHNSPKHGDICRSPVDRNIWNCPRYCKEVSSKKHGRDTKAPYCFDTVGIEIWKKHVIGKDGKSRVARYEVSKPCRTQPPEAPILPPPPPRASTTPAPLSPSLLHCAANAKGACTTKPSTSAVVVGVLTRRTAFGQRRAIRATWSKGHSNVYFVVGRGSDDVADEAIDRKLLGEHKSHGDMFFVPAVVDNYRSLPKKLKALYAWVLATNPNAEWIVKADDDMVVRVCALSRYLVREQDSSKPSVVGEIKGGNNMGRKYAVNRRGKWGENVYKPLYYPEFPLGASGYAISRPVFKYFVDHSNTLVDYQGEDTSCGIWLHESPLRSKVRWVYSKRVTSRGDCNDTDKLIVGHKINASTMIYCRATNPRTEHC